jgi:hypothetical protein
MDNFGSAGRVEGEAVPFSELLFQARDSHVAWADVSAWLDSPCAAELEIRTLQFYILRFRNYGVASQIERRDWQGLSTPATQQQSSSGSNLQISSSKLDTIVSLCYVQHNLT